MTRRTKRKSVESARSVHYQKVAEHFYDAAKDSMELEYWTAAGVLIVHSAIAFSDALCIQQSGQRSVGEDHEDVIVLLESVLSETSDKVKAMNQLKRMIEEKTRVSYLGELYTQSQTKELWKRLERFRSWAIDILNR